MKLQKRTNHIKSFLTVLLIVLLLSVFAACSDVSDGTSKTEITSGVSSVSENMFSSDFPENSIITSSEEITEEFTHGEYESSEKTETTLDNVTAESSEEFTHGEYESSEAVSEESDVESSEEMSEDRTHGEYESSEEDSFEETTSEDVSPGESTSEESSSEEDVSSEESSVEVHTCQFEKNKTVSANCTQKGYTVYKCSCGKTENREYVSALGHKEGDWVVVTEATVSSTGLKRKSCTRCGEKLDEEVIAKLQTSHTCNYVKISTVSATCTEQGYSIYKCSCGKTENREYVSALGHKEGDWVILEEPGETSDGFKQKSCTRCGTPLAYEFIEATGPDAKYYAYPSADKESLIEERILYYLNYFRSLDGVSEAGTLLNGKTYLFAQGRAEQLTTNFAHDTDAERQIATQLEFGKYYPEEPEQKYDFETGEFYYTGNITPAYYYPVCGEAITRGYFTYSTIDGLAYAVAEGCYESKAHWSYVGAETTKYITVGSCLYKGEWFFALITTDGSYD